MRPYGAISAITEPRRATIPRPARADDVLFFAILRRAGAEQTKNALQEGDALHAAAQSLQIKRQKFIDLYGESRMDRGPCWIS